MGQQLSPSLEAEPSAAIMNQLSNRFTILPHPYYSNTTNLKLLNDRTTNLKYVLRIITTNNESEHHKIEELINKKIANKNNFITKLEQYFFEHEKSYCGNLSKCYLLFNVGQAIAAKDYFFIKQTSNNYEEYLLMGLNQLINGLLWLKNMQTPHGNISSQNVYLSKDQFILADPWIAPEGADLHDRFPSPEKLMKINNKIEDYDLYASDLYSIGMTILEISKKQKLDRIYKKNYTVNLQVLIDQIEKCPYPKLKERIKYILLSSENNRRQYLYDHETAFKIDQQNKENNQAKKQKGGIRRINVMSNRENPIKTNNHINYQHEAQPRNFSKENKVENHFIHHENSLPLPIPHQSPLIFTFHKQTPADMSQLRPRSSSQSKVNFNFAHPAPLPSAMFMQPLFSPPQQLFHHQPINSNIYDKFPKFTLKQQIKPQNTSFNATQLNKYTDNTHESASKSNKKISLNDKLNRYYYQKVVNYQSQNNINYTFDKPCNPPLQPSLPSIPSFTSQSYLSKIVAVDRDDFREQKEKPQRLNQHTPLNYKPVTNPDSNSAEFNEYLHCIDEKINKFQAGVSNAIQNTIMQIQKTPQVQEKESFNTVEEIRKSQKQKIRGISYYTTSNPPNSQVNADSHITNQSEVNLPQSCHPNEQKKKQSEQLSDSLLLEINLIGSQDKIEIAQNNRESEVQVVSAVAYGVSSQQFKMEQGDNVLRSFSNEPQNEEEEESRNTIIHGTQLQSVSNLAIPEEASSQEESFDSNMESENKGLYCEEYYENGGVYKGIIKNGERNGQGTFYYRDGGYYEGQWKDNKMNGFGRLYYESGDLAYQGQWFRDEFHGRGKIYNDNPDKLAEPFDYKDFESQDLYWKYYEGDLSYDTKQGHGKLILSNGEFFIGQFKGDRPSGRGHFHQLNKKIIHGIWQKGKLIKQI